MQSISFVLRPLAAATLAALAVSPLAAQTRQPTVVVTATRTAISADRALASVSVIGRSDIESAGAIDLVALLSREAGVDIVRSGGLGQQTSVFLRGANSNQLLVLIDGIRAAAATTGSYAWEHLPLEQIERIEIVRGPRAALYGSDAIGGVIQIFTRRVDGLSGAVGGGSHDTAIGEAAYGHRGERWRVGLRGSLVDTEGFSAQNRNGYAFDPDRDGSTRRHLGADADIDFGRVKFEAHGSAGDSEIEFDRGVSDVEQRFGRIALSGDAGRWLLAAAHTGETLETPAIDARFTTRRRQLDWQHSGRVGERGEWLWGLAHVADRGGNYSLASGAANYRGDRDHRAAFASWRDGRGAWDWELAARHDDYDVFGGETSHQAALGWQYAGAGRLRASWAEGFRAPNLNELLSPGFGGLFAGNPALDPERSRALELGVVQPFGDHAFDLRVYRNDVHNLIDFAGAGTFQAINIGRARLQGAEAEWRFERAEWTLAGALGWQQAENRDSGTALIRRAPRKASLRIERALGRGRAGLEWQAVSARPEFGGDLPGYAVAAAFVRWPLGDRLDLDVRLHNLTDRDYELLRGFNTAGFGGQVLLRWR